MFSSDQGPLVFHLWKPNPVKFSRAVLPCRVQLAQCVLQAGSRHVWGAFIYTFICCFVRLCVIVVRRIWDQISASERWVLAALAAGTRLLPVHSFQQPVSNNGCCTKKKKPAESRAVIGPPKETQSLMLCCFLFSYLNLIKISGPVQPVATCLPTQVSNMNSYSK